MKVEHDDRPSGVGPAVSIRAAEPAFPLPPLRRGCLRELGSEAQEPIVTAAAPTPYGSSSSPEDGGWRMEGR